MLTPILQPRHQQARACGEKTLNQIYVSSDDKKDRKHLESTNTLSPVLRYVICQIWT